MSPILGIWASGISGSKAITGNYYSIQTATVDSGGSATITFSSIPSTYTHLQIRAISKFSATDGGSTRINFNSDSGSNYTYHYLFGDGATVTAGAGTSSTITIYNAAGQDTTYFNSSVIDILDYANTSKYKTIRSLYGTDKNGSGVVGINSGLWMSTSAINSITFTPQSANFSQYTTFSLYGVK